MLLRSSSLVGGGRRRKKSSGTQTLTMRSTNSAKLSAEKRVVAEKYWRHPPDDLGVAPLVVLHPDDVSLDHPDSSVSDVPPFSFPLALT